MNFVAGSGSAQRAFPFHRRKMFWITIQLSVQFWRSTERNAEIKKVFRNELNVWRDEAGNFSSMLCRTNWIGISKTNFELKAFKIKLKFMKTIQKLHREKA